MELLIGILIGLSIGALTCYFIMKHSKPSGTFVMDFTDPMKDICRIELSEGLNSLYSKKRIVLSIKVHE